MIRLILAAMVSVFTFSSPSNACEMHAKAAAEKREALPGQSIYNLDSEWSDQRGAKAKLSALTGHPRLIAMVYTKCPTACPLTVQELKNMRSKLTPAQRSLLKISLFSFDEKENTESLRSFSEKYALDESWTLHRSSSAAVAELAAALNVHYKRLPNGEYVHANVFFLVDENGVVLAQSEGLGGPSESLSQALGTIASGNGSQTH